MAHAGGVSRPGGEAAPLYVGLAAVLAAVGGLLFGYDTGVISGAILFIRREFPIDDTLEGLVVSAVTLGALVGAFIAGTLADRVGRRPTNIAAGALFIFASLVCAFAPGVWALVAGRLVVGVAIGLSSVAAPMFIAEIAPPAIRGRLVSVFQLAITLGILAAYVVDGALAESAAWRWMLGLAALPGALLTIGMLPLPDTPRWLVKQGRDAEAHEVLRHIRALGDVDVELAEIKNEIARESDGRWSDLFGLALRPALLVGIGLAVFQQITGINAVIYYAPQIFQNAGFESDTVALAATMGIGAVNVAATFIAIGLVDRVGRRPLLLWGVAGMLLSLAILGVAFADSSATGAGAASNLGWITVVCLTGYIVCFAFSLGPVVWLMISEIFPYKNRAQAVAVCTAMNWGANFVVSLTFPVLRSGVGTAATLWIYAALGLVTLLFIALRVPETSGRSLEEIESLWSGEPRATGGVR